MTSEQAKSDTINNGVLIRTIVPRQFEERLRKLAVEEECSLSEVIYRLLKRAVETK